jgi:glucokinase
MAPAISQTALEGRDPLCLETLDLFLLLFGREAGNHALKLMATGGVYLGGGITPRVLSRLKSSRFLEAFFDKGRMRPLMEAMPVRVILNEKAALLGALYYAISNRS